MDDLDDKALDPKFERIGYKDQVLDIINSLELPSKTDKHILKSRFLYEVLYYDARRNHAKKYYNGFRFIVTVGSILLPALLSIGQMDPAKLPNNFDQVSYWSTWGISLTVTVCNGFLQLFSLDKNYFECSLTSEQLKTEGWQFFQLSGKYDDYEDHKEAYRPFCKSIENIKRKQIEKEFSGKGESKKKKDFNFQQEFNKELQKASNVAMPTDVHKPAVQDQVPLSTDSDMRASLLSLLSSVSPDKAQTIKTLTDTVDLGKDIVADSKDTVKEDSTEITKIKDDTKRMDTSSTNVTK
jgi:hypothetical protein